MINKLKKKFIILAMSSAFLLLCIIITGMNLINYRSIVMEADKLLEMVSKKPDGPGIPNAGGPNQAHDSKYFSVLADEEKDVFITDSSKIASLNASYGETIAKKVLKKGASKGFIDNYRYDVKSENNVKRIYFLDCERNLSSFKSFLSSSITMAVFGLVMVFVIVTVYAGKIIRPIAESYEKQRQFITDAGHEIKTPLTIISANVDLLMMDLGDDNESLSDIKEQTLRLSTLTQELVELSKLEESDETMTKIDFPVSEVILEAAHPYVKLALAQNKTFDTDIQPLLTLCGDASGIKRLTGILLDNAFKYADKNGRILIKLTKQNKSIILSVFNTTGEDIASKELSHIFERFYRTDASRNSETGGHGIGLSIARVIVTSHGGKISASSSGHSFTITAVLPGV